MTTIKSFVGVKPISTEGAAIPKDGLYWVSGSANFHYVQVARLKDREWQMDNGRKVVRFGYWDYFYPIPKTRTTMRLTQTRIN